MSFSMTGSNKRIVVLLATIALGGGIMVVCSGQPATDQVEPENSASELSRPKTEAGGRADLALANDPDSGGGLSYNPEGGIYYRMMLAVLFVAVLGAAAIYVSRKLLPRLTSLPGKEIRVTETVYLGPRKAVHMVEVGGRRFLIGSTNENVTKLADMTDEVADFSVQDENYG